MSEESFDCIILGGGPAGLSAALYARRANLNCAIVDVSAIGGTPANYCEIENYLGKGNLILKKIDSKTSKGIGNTISENIFWF